MTKPAMRQRVSLSPSHNQATKAANKGTAAFKMEDMLPSAQPKFPDSPEFFKLLLIFVVVVFLLVAVAMPLLYTLPSPPPKLS